MCVYLYTAACFFSIRKRKWVDIYSILKEKWLLCWLFSCCAQSRPSMAMFFSLVFTLQESRRCYLPFTSITQGAHYFKLWDCVTIFSVLSFSFPLTDQIIDSRAFSANISPTAPKLALALFGHNLIQFSNMGRALHLLEVGAVTGVREHLIPLPWKFIPATSVLECWLCLGQPAPNWMLFLGEALSRWSSSQLQRDT